MELPILEGISLDQILEVRQNDGQAFQNFRIELEKQLHKLRQTKDPDTLTIGVQEAEHELADVQINEIDKKVAKLRRSLIGNVIVGGVGLAATIQTAGLLAVPTLLYIAKELKDYNQARMEPRENPAFFLWQLRAKKR